MAQVVEVEISTPNVKIQDTSGVFIGVIRNK